MPRRRRQPKKDEKEKDFDEPPTKCRKVSSQTIEIASTCKVKIIF
jgi:hypothetical protein